MKITRKLMGVGLVLMLLVSMLVMSVPVSAGTLSWTVSTDIPDATDKVVQDGTTLYDMAVSADGQTIYVAAFDNGIYKSVNGGDSWSAVSIPAAVTGNITMVAMAPDDSDIVVFIGNTTGLTTNLTAYVSTNGGSTFNSLSTIQDTSDNASSQIYDVAISPLSAGVRYIAAAGVNDTAASGAAIYYFNLGATTPVWKDAVTDFTSGLTVTGIESFRSVAFSPNFPSDQVMVGVSEDTSTTAGAVHFHIASFNQQKWDASVFTGYPVSLTVTGESANVSAVSAADISLDPEYLAGDDSTRIAMVGVAVTRAGTAEGGLYRLKDTTVKELKADTAINSVAWDGADLAAGAYADNNVYRCADALASSPTVSTSRSYKEIGVDDPDNNDQVIVRWGASGTLLGVKQYLSSAFSRSTDNGKVWNDIALVDTTLSTMDDLWVSPDGSVTYLLSTDTSSDNTTSLWKKASAWQRIFSINVEDTAPAGYIVRAAAGNPDVVYIADNGNGATAMYYTTDGGTEKWVVRASRYDIVDMAVQDADIAYVANYDNDEVSKTTNGGFTWDADVDSKSAGGTCATLTLLADDELLLGTTTGYVSYSSDGNGSWTKITPVLNVAGNTQVTASGLATGDYIYAASSGNTTRVERWQIGQTGTTWKNLAAPVSENYTCTGLIFSDGALFALTAETVANDSALLRTLDPTSATPAASKWVTVASAAEDFSRTPSALRLSTGSTTLWALDTVTTGLWSMVDTLATGLEIELVSPVAGYENPTNPVTGYTQDISFKWNKPSSGTASVAYEVRIKAADGATSLLTATRAATDSAAPSLLIGPDQGTGFTLNFTPGQTYYWQVRSTTPLDSPWSALRAFTIAELPEVVPPVVITQAPAPVITAPAPITITQVPAPQITVTAPAPAPATTITIPAAPAVPAPITPGFIWAIIIIGAILVIAVVVLIVRTRRTV